MGRVDLPVLAGYKAQPKLRGGLFGLGILSCYAQEVRRGNLPIACCRATHAGKSRSPSHTRHRPAKIWAQGRSRKGVCHTPEPQFRDIEDPNLGQTRIELSQLIRDTHFPENLKS